MIEQVWADQIRERVKEDVEDWGSYPDGPFNTDPFIEPRVDYLSEKPEYSILDSVEENGRLWMFVIFRCDGTIRCKKYKDHGDDKPLSTPKFSGGVTFEIDVNLYVELGTGEVDFHINCLAWEKWPKWSKQRRR